jgi:hypothetical protein
MAKLLNILTSLRLTVICLVLALGLVFFGTLAQVKWGLYVVQHDFFGSFLVWWKPQGGSWKFPVWPGGYLLGGVLLLNLIAAHIKRFKFTKKKIGIFTIHAGLILLLVGQLFTQLFQVESFMRVEEGEAKNYSESSLHNELAIVDVTDPKTDTVVAIPDHLLSTGSQIADRSLPFKVKIDSFMENSLPRVAANSHSLVFDKQALATATDDRNLPAATVEVVTDKGSQGAFTVSNWIAEDQLKASIARQIGSRLKPDFAAPPRFTYQGHTYEMFLRPIRYYKPFTLKLEDFTHETYKGTDVPKNFSSRVQLINPDTKENREVLIYMNNPLRYNGETYYQASFEKGDKVSIFQVVRNPGWMTPYLACLMVGSGLLIQFLSHLVAFAKKRSA